MNEEKEKGKEKGKKPPDELAKATSMEVGYATCPTKKVEIVGELKGKADVQLGRSAALPTDDQPLWVPIRDRAKKISFPYYRDFINRVLCNVENKVKIPSHGICEDSPGGARKKAERQFDELYAPLHGVGAYDLLKTVTEAFLLLNCGVAIVNEKQYNSENEEASRLENWDDVSFDKIKEELGNYLKPDGKLPYIDRIVRAAFPKEGEVESPYCYGILKSKAHCPCLLELIWSYWHEEGMLVQSLNAISMRFQNKRLRATGGDPLAYLELDPLRPLNNILWGYIQDEQHRLTIPRRTYEYDHHYGLRLYGKAVPEFQPADSRSKFLEAFHNLLHLCSIFFKEDDDTTVIADGFPVLNGLKEVHLLLSEGAHNQFGDLPSTARMEMLMEEWLLARPEMREFLVDRIMVAYPEPWMGRVDTMKKLQRWTDTPVTHFRDLGVFGEQILLSIRFGAWGSANDPAQAANWARYWRPEIQGYIHAYRAVTGVDLTSEPVDSTMPAVHLRKRLAMQLAKR